MNELIREFERESGLEIYRLGKERYRWEHCVEKFAELIVKECMKAADEGMAQVTMKVEWPSYHIKKHFGIE